MLNPFPELLSFVLLAPFLLRITAGVLFAQFGYLKLTKERGAKMLFFEGVGLKPGVVFVWIFGIVELVGGIMLIAGFLTQIAAIILSLIMLGAVFIKLRFKEMLPSCLSFYVLIFITTVSLVFSGAGAFALDLPL